ncbi:MAG: hypothetical protein WCZ72_00505 [Gemmobacter sp.]
MIALIRLALLGFVALTVLYVLVWLYARSLRRERLEQRWEAKGRHGDRAAYVRRGMQQYERSLRRRLLWLVYIIPAMLVVTIVYLLNFT